MAALLLKPPAPLVIPSGMPAVFLAGSIDQGRAEPWQEQVEAALADLPVAVLNPRRQAWDAGWEQRADNPLFRGQVEWELDALDLAAVILMYFAPASQAPITLLELGLHAAGGKLIVCCPPGFWRKGNVDLVCERHAVPLAGDLAELIALGRRALLERL
ncbi:MAG TPA: nucleoside 2-deoxyribosyltransferase domain-containing protein [Herpetosiphonaceae bacterium]